MKTIAILLSVFLSLSSTAQNKWTTEKATEWGKAQPWYVGCNYIPATAINQIEMWQAATFDTATIQKELALAHQTGFNIIRVFLHEVVYRYDSLAYKNRIGQFLNIADRNHVKVMFVLFDDCWNADPKPGPQPAPIQGLHNSGWMQCPGKKDVLSPIRWNDLQKYTVGIISAFANDSRVAIWDVYNEPGNSGLHRKTIPLLTKVFEWARAANPGQPLTSGIYSPATSPTQIKYSDIITFHNYSDAQEMKAQIEKLKQLNRPLICSEYMARTNNSTFKDNLPVLAAENTGAINWGFVNGKTNTIYPWSTKSKHMEHEPAIWFHDIYRQGGTPFDPEEIKLIKAISAEKNKR